MGFPIVDQSKTKLVGGGEFKVARRGPELDVRI